MDLTVLNRGHVIIYFAALLFGSGLALARQSNPPKCYTVANSPWAVHSLFKKLEIVPPINTLVPLTSVAEFSYWNLSCPWEWSKYSCAHQHQSDKARASIQFVRDILNGSASCSLDPFNGEAFVRLLQGRTLVFFGDSLSRQHFISTACLLYSSKNVKLEKDGIIWSSKWVCHGARNCISSGRHSGFLDGCVSFAVGDSACNVCFEEHKDASDIRQELEKIKMKHNLSSHHDIVLANLGVHGSQIANVPWLISAAKAGAPIIIYRETSPQHFSSLSGEYTKSIGVNNCKPSIGSLQRLQAKENSELVGRMPFLAINSWSAQAGELKIGAGSGNVPDCQHWCMPGVPDVWSVQLFNYLQTYLALL
jgi:hypothetical protein